MTPQYPIPVAWAAQDAGLVALIPLLADAATRATDEIEQSREATVLDTLQARLAARAASAARVGALTVSEGQFVAETARAIAARL